MDPIIHDFLQCITANHAATNYEPDMPTLANRLGQQYRRHDYSFYDPANRTVYVRHDATAQEARADAAHELTHAIGMTGHPSYEQVIRHYHASVPNIEEHLEELTEHGADRLLMPDALVTAITRHCGLTARAVWELSRFANVTINDALRRIVHANPDTRIGGFYSTGGYVQAAHTLNWWMPFWIGDRIPEPHILLEHGATTYRVPGKPRHLLCLVVISDYEAA
ncbi:ImmA/IrrE family metallo-endopeptidase [Deinococcus sp. 6GRE01]|uniref:ImmA/IrrE family metallo-endopeptidase n=1 Tax=Deinococcus sp. 6GRE01 TaxID=2745873 RepID=UPI001E387B28|nr:ImmA/IrrE family metallo-endopeptidase [Deinococcus sp. 6GRE01]MCD0157180.1 hypothetical protein [Deinococcus sp. 6GRE01]